MFVVIIECVHGSGHNAVNFSVGKRFYFAFTFDAENGLKMILITDVSLGAGKDRRFMKREAVGGLPNFYFPPRLPGRFHESHQECV